MDSGIYARVRLAAIELATGKEPPGKRLVSAFAQRLLVLRPTDFPDELQEDFALIRRDLTACPPNQSVDCLNAIVQAMDETQIEEYIKKIVDLYGRASACYFTELCAYPD